MLITQTPLRVSFVGGGTDLPDFYRQEGGEVLSTAINKYIYVIIKERFDDVICINYSRKEVVQEADEIQHELVRESLRKLGITSGIEITFLADIPSRGSGLGSSSSVTVGLLNALYAYKGVLVSAETLAREACEIEIDILGQPIGKQDQYIAAYGGIRHIQFHKDDSVVAEEIPCSEKTRRYLMSHLLMFYTGITRQATTILAEQRRNIQDRLDYLRNLKALVPRLKSLLLDMEKGPTRDHIIEFGNLLHTNWLLKRELASPITNEKLDEIYRTAIQAGAIGGKLLGAGGGGFFLFCVPLERQEAVRYALQQLRELPFRFARDGSKVIFNIRQD